MNGKTRQHRPRQQTATQVAAERAKRARFQAERPGLAALLATGDYTDPVSQGEYWELRQTLLRLKSLREAAGLSLADVSERTGIDRAALSRLENGITPNPTINTLTRYAEALGKRLVVTVQDHSA